LSIYGRQQDQVTRLGEHNLEEGGHSKGFLSPYSPWREGHQDRAVERDQKTAGSQP
jgi:hypothetical protein